jgi:DNA-binding transcriptional regulator YhcF (GntR family)
MVMRNLSAHDVRDLIIDRITHGIYPLGSKLPTTVELASETGAHRNTIAKAYRALADVGLITLKQGRGSFVSSLVGPENQSAISVQIQGQIAESLRKARGLGIPEAELRQAIDEQITASYRVNLQRAAFVECNLGDARAAVDEIEAITGYRLVPLLLDDLQSSPLVATDGCAAVFTSLFHIKEVSDLLDQARPGLSVVGVYTHPDERALGEIARIRPGSQVGIVCASSEGSRRFANQIATFANVTTTTLVRPTDADILQVAKRVETIVSSRSCASQVQSLKLEIPIIPLPFHVSQQSAGRVAEILANSWGGATPRDNGLLTLKGVLA